MAVINSVIETIVNMGATVMLPVVFFIMSLVFRMKIKDGIKAALYVGIGYQGMMLAIDFLNGILAPAQEYYEAQGSGFLITDMPWPVVGAMPFTMSWALIAIPIMVVISILLVRFKVFKTLNVDIWSYSRFLLTGAFVWILFGSLPLALLATLAMFILGLALSDHYAPRWSESLGMPNTTTGNLTWMLCGGPVCFVVNKIIDLIPGLRDLDMNPEWMRKNLGIFGEESVIGLILGLLLGLMTEQGLQGTLTMGMGLAAAMVLLPHIVKIFVEGIGMITSAASEWSVKVLGEGRELNIAVDIAMSLGNPTAVTVGSLLVPFALIIALVVPGITYFPIGVMVSVVYYGGWCSMYCKQNFIRALICGCVFVLVSMFIVQVIAPEVTMVAGALGVEATGEMTSAVFGDWDFLLLSLLHRVIPG